MKKRIFRLLLLVVCIFGCEIGYSQTLKMMTYNIQGHNSNATRTENVAKLINAAKPDLVALQEVDLKFHDYLTDLATATGMHQEFLNSENAILPKFGVAVLSKVAPTSRQEIIIQPREGSKDSEKRAILITEFPDYYFISTHYSLDADDRDTATDTIIAFAKKATKTVFVAGDFNAKPTYRAIVTFKNNGFAILNNENVFTFPAEAPDGCIDMILSYTPAESAKKYLNPVTEIPAVDGLLYTDASDHLPLAVTVESGVPMVVTDVATLRTAIGMATANEITEINFNVPSGELDFTNEGVIDLKGKKINVNGPIAFKNGKTLFSASSASEIAFKDVTVDGFSAIALKLSGKSTLVADNCKFLNNGSDADANNGGVFRVSSANIEVKNSYFENNGCGGSYGGGAICVYGTGGSLKAYGCTFNANKAKSGGAISVKAQKALNLPVNITNCTFVGNLANDRGGALYLQTETTSGVFAPQIVNCTFVNNKSANLGGAINAWSKASTTMEPILVNNLFGANYQNYKNAEKVVENDVLAYYLAGATTGAGDAVPQTVFPVCSNNVYVSAQENFFGANDVKADFTQLFKTTVTDEIGGIAFEKVETTGEGNKLVAMIGKKSPAIKAGTATFKSLEIPTVDQLGVARPEKPAAGAVESDARVAVITDIATLRAAVTAADNVSFTDFIFDVPSGELDFTGEGVIDVKEGKQIIINGPITFKNGTTLFSLSGGSKMVFVDATIDNFSAIAVKISGNSGVQTINCNFLNNGVDTNTNNGGVFRVSSSILMTESSYYKNNGSGGSYGGGAICAYGPGQLAVENCTFEGNKAKSGGAISVKATKGKASTFALIRNCTFADNLANDRAGAIYLQTETETDVLAPQIINCTFVNNKSANLGGAINAWSKATTTMKPILVNNLFGANYQNYKNSEKVVENDVLAYYLAGGVTAAGDEVPQTVFPTCSHNVYVSAQENFFGAEDKQVAFDGLFKTVGTVELNGITFNSVELEGEGAKRVAMIPKTSPAVGAGIKNFESLFIPTFDQLGVARHDALAAGAVESDGSSSVAENFAENTVKVWANGTQLYVEGLEDSAEMRVFDLTGKQVFAGQVEAGSVVELDVEKGIYLVNLNGVTYKLAIR